MLFFGMTIGAGFAIAIFLVALPLLWAAVVKHWKGLASIIILFFVLVALENIAGAGGEPPEWFWVFELVFAIAAGFIAGLSKANKNKLEAKKETPDIPEKAEYLRFWLADVEQFCSAREIKRLSYCPKIRLSASYDKSNGTVREITVIADFKPIGLVPKEYEKKVMRLMTEKRIVAAFLPEHYYDYKMCNGMVEIELAYNPC